MTFSFFRCTQIVRFVNNIDAFLSPLQVRLLFLACLLGIVECQQPAAGKSNSSKPVDAAAATSALVPAVAEDMQAAASSYDKGYGKPKPKKPYYGSV